MAKLRYGSANDPLLKDFEWEGTPQELLEIYDGLKERLGNTLQVENSIPRQYNLPQKPIIRPANRMRSDYSELAKKMPSVEQLMVYILGKPKFEHDIIDVGMKFFGKPIKSREYGRLYRHLRSRLDEARKRIEASEHGAFERKPTPNRNLPAYTFKKISATSLDMSLQKTS